MPPTRSRLDEPLVRAVGSAAKKLANLGLETVGDLLRHVPRRYVERGQLTDFASLQVGDHVTVTATVLRVTEPPFRGGTRRLEAIITDGRGRLALVFFAKNRWAIEMHRKRLVEGHEGIFSGTLGEFRGKLQLAYPDYLMVGEGVESAAEAADVMSRPVPVYPAATGIPTWTIRKCLDLVLDTLSAEDIPTPVPAHIRAEYDLVDAYTAYLLAHRPADLADVGRAAAYFRMEEALVLQTALAQRRTLASAAQSRPRPSRSDGVLAAFDAALPFGLTAGQVEVGEVLAKELAREHPMQRLLQGEVGTGKTVVALRAMLQVVDAGGQAALLAPTEVLAAQHAESIAAMLGSLGRAGQLDAADGPATAISLLTGSASAPGRREELARIASGEAGIVIGTHALLNEEVQFADLGLVVVDEQHRFGVEQRDRLRTRGDTPPHLLVMTATPIPRTVAMTVFGDLDISTLRELPAGRAEVVTHVVPWSKPNWVQRVWEVIGEEVATGGRAYVVCARIDATDAAGADGDQGETAGERRGSDSHASTHASLGDDDADLIELATPPRRPLTAVTDLAPHLAEQLAPIEVSVMHGRLAAPQKAAAMAAFVDGSAPVMVSTTVIEVGVNVPAATVMVVVDADRFGLSQLHQLRGRIGRGDKAGQCFLIGEAEPGSPAATRLAALERTRDGFELAQVDLELRREGDVLGVAQSGRSSLRWLRLAKDADLIERARHLARGLVDTDPDLDAHPALADAVQRFSATGSDEYLQKT